MHDWLNSIKQQDIMQILKTIDILRQARKKMASTSRISNSLWQIYKYIYIGLYKLFFRISNSVDCHSLVYVYSRGEIYQQTGNLFTSIRGEIYQ